MKKLLLSLSVIIVFALFSWHQQNELADIRVGSVPSSGSVTPTDTPTPTTSQSSSTPTTTVTLTDTPTPIPPSNGRYKNGTYTGSVADAFYGNIQVQVSIQNGKIADVQFLQYPNDRRTSVEINTQAMPYLRQEAIAAQNAQVDIVSGATDSSKAFRESLGSALAQAQ